MTLLEVLIAILIFSLGLLGIVGLQVRAIQFSVGAEDSNRAALLTNEISASMQLYQTVNLPEDVTDAWQTRVSTPSVAGLVEGLGEITPTSANTATVTITWSSLNAASGADSYRYVTQVVIP